MQITDSFIFVGPGKCGTTTYYSSARLSQYPLIALSKTKETNYLLKTNSQISLDGYHKHFRFLGKELATLEFSNLYFFSVLFAENAKILPNPKLVVTIRDPIKRIVSHLLQYNRLHGIDSLDRLLDIHQDVVFRSMYSLQLEKFAKHMRDQILIVTLEDLAANPALVFGKINNFLGHEVYPSSGAFVDSSAKIFNPKVSSRNPLLTRTAKLIGKQARVVAPSLFQAARDSRLFNRLLFKETCDSASFSSSVHDYLALVFKEEYIRLRDQWGIVF